MSPRLATCRFASWSMDGTRLWQVGAGIRVVCRRMSNIHQTFRRKRLADVMHNTHLLPCPPVHLLTRRLGGRIKPKSISGALNWYMPWPRSRLVVTDIT